MNETTEPAPETKKFASVKMRASLEGRHISGAEGLLPGDLGETALADCIALLRRGLTHLRGAVDEIHLKLTAVPSETLQHLDALPVRTITVTNAVAGRAAAIAELTAAGIADAEQIFARLPEIYGMRGAMLLDVDTGKRWEPNRERGVRVTNMDAVDVPSSARQDKNHFREALVLATKTIAAPGIIAEFCVSDDPHYVTGYVATRAGGYVRITCLKEDGDANGGRIFLFRGDSTTAARCIEFLEHTPVLVHRAPLIPPAPTETSPSPTTRSGAAAAPDKWRFMRAALTAQREQNLCRSLTEIATPPAPTVQVAGRSLLLLASNNYLDLANEPRVKEAAAQAALTYGAGSGGARLLTGNQPPHSQLERQLAAFKGVEAALLFGTGYQANVGTIAAIADAEWTIFSDELNHASIIDGCRLSKAKIVVYPHNNMTALRALLTRERPTRGLIVSDAVFSMDGDIVDLPALLELSDEFNLLTLLDEAHATGVLGVTGRGVCEHFNLSRKPDIIIGTGSKALGSIGGFAAGSRLLIDFLLNRARSFIFSTALPASAVAATAQALTIIENEPWRVAKLQTNRQIFCRELQTRGLLATGENLAAPGSAIIPIIVGDEAAAMRAAQELLARGVFLSAIRYPTVARGQARLRVALSAGHSAPDLITAAQVICDVVKAPAR